MSLYQLKPGTVVLIPKSMGGWHRDTFLICEDISDNKDVDGLHFYHAVRISDNPEAQIISLYKNMNCEIMAKP